MVDKTSLLGWDMDHAWPLRPGVWTLRGEWRDADGGWTRLDGLAELERDHIGYRFPDGIGPVRSLELESGRRNHRPWSFRLGTPWLDLEGVARTFGRRLHLLARAGSWIFEESGTLLADGSVQVAGSFSRLGEVREAWCWTLSLRPDPGESWELPAEVLEQIRSQARAGAPIEQCGLLVGIPEERRIVAQIAMVNLDASEDHFTMDPREQFRATKSLRGTGREIVGSWHSHPFSPARLSDEDLALAVDETALYAVVSLMEPGEAPLRLHRVRQGRVSRIEVRLV